MSEPERRCAGCGGALHPAQLIERGDHGVSYPLRYELSDATAARLVGVLPRRGAVTAFVCADCGRFDLYAAAILDAIASREGPEPCLACGTEIPVEADRCPACGWTWNDPAADPHP